MEFIYYTHITAACLWIVLINNNLFSFGALKGKCFPWVKGQISPLFPSSSLWLLRAAEPQLKTALVIPDFPSGIGPYTHIARWAQEVCPRKQDGLKKTGEALFSFLVSAMFTAANGTLHIWGWGLEEERRCWEAGKLLSLVFLSLWRCAILSCELIAAHVPLCDRGGDWLNILPSWD